MPADKASSSYSSVVARRLLSALGIAACVALAACGGGLAPVHNVQHAPVITAGGQQPSAQQVRDAIMRALLSRGWQVDREGPDGVVATTVSRGNSATVLVQYDARAYSISYLDSSPSLKFNGSSIHRRYNDWIDKLDKTIRKLLAEPAYYPPPLAAPGYQHQAPPPPPAAEPAPATAPPSAAGGLVPAPPPAAPAPEVAPQYQAPPPPPPPAPAPRK